MRSETFLHERSIAALAVPSHSTGPFPIWHVHSMGSAQIAVPSLPTGGHFFDLWPVRELPELGLWAATQYTSFAPPLFVLHEAVVHSSAGILAAGDSVIAESLSNTSPNIHSYRQLVKGIALQPKRISRLAGSHISLLAAGEQDIRHALLGSLARLMAVPDAYFAAADGVLVPQGGVAQAEMLGLFDLLPSLSVREVARDETLVVDTLIYPLSVCGEAVYHPCVGEFYRRLSANVPAAPARLPRRIYIDSRGTGLRPLRNEAELIVALARVGFEPVRPETMSLSDQIMLFRQAEAIVAPHGSALTNLGFARPGCLIVELLMDAFVDWSFRNLAALMKLRYDCVLGRARRPWPDLNVQFHQTPWEISVNHVVAAVAHSLSVSPAQAA